MYIKIYLKGDKQQKIITETQEIVEAKIRTEQEMLQIKKKQVELGKKF